ncbi:hypothetical protein, partial [Streptomyces sp. DSM 41978]|uniref:hypothetical protein n=1 Tax=Streptomyces sp. DSM 41978 TaxID=3448658 RepID=UPI00403FD32B
GGDTKLSDPSDVTPRIVALTPRVAQRSVVIKPSTENPYTASKHDSPHNPAQLISRVMASQYVWRSSARTLGANATTTVITWRML